MSILDGTVLYSRNLKGICLMVAASARFRTLTGAANAAAALAGYVHFPEAPDDESGDMPPFAIVQPGDLWTRTDHGTLDWREDGNAYISLLLPPTASYLDLPGDTASVRRDKRRNRAMEFANNASQILSEICDLSGQDGGETGYSYPKFATISLVDGPAECMPREERGEANLFLGATWEVRW